MVVTGVAEDGANAAAGVEVGSFILSIDGKDVVNRAQVLSLLQQTKELFAPGDPSAYVMSNYAAHPAPPKEVRRCRCPQRIRCGKHSPALCVHQACVHQSDCDGSDL